MTKSYILMSIATMAIITYLIRVIPMLVFKSKIKNQFLKSFIYYVPYVVLSIMTFPAIFYSTNYFLSALLGTILALILSYYDLGLVKTMSISAIFVYLVEMVINTFTKL